MNQIITTNSANTGNLTTWAADINAAHAEATRHAGKAIDYAKQAGLLLLKVKQKLPHGEFGNWLESNCHVSDRQARRYMEAAQGKAISVPAIAAKTDIMSDLPAWLPTDPNVLATLDFSRLVACPDDDGGTPEMRHPRLLVQRMDKDDPHWKFEEDRPFYFAVFMEGNDVQYTAKPQPGWMVAYSIGMFAGGRMTKNKKMVQALSMEFEGESALRAHAELGWEYSNGIPQFVSSLVDVLHPFNPMEH